MESAIMLAWQINHNQKYCWSLSPLTFSFGGATSYISLVEEGNMWYILDTQAHFNLKYTLIF